MNFSDEFFDEDSNLFIDNDKLKSKVQKCKEYVSTGQTIAFLDNIEHTIQLCLEYDFTEDGIYLAEAALEISPYSSELWHSKGMFYNNLFEFEQAYLCFTKALTLNPSDVETMINKSIAEDNLGMWDEAISTLNNALTYDPNNEEVVFNLGIFHEKNNHFEKAIEYFNKTVQLDSDYGDAWYELGYCYESTNKFDKAINAYKRFLDIEPYSASGWYNYGIVYLRLGENNKAINCFELATAVNEDFSNAWYNCGLAYSKINKFVDARSSFLKAFELDPFDDLIPFNIAQSFEATGDYQSAIKYFDETLKISNSNIDAYVGRGNCYARKNDHIKMIENFSMVIKYTYANNLSELSSEDLVAKLEDLYSKIEIYSIPILDDSDLLKLAESYFEVGRWNDAMEVYKKTLKSNHDLSNSYFGISLCMFMLNKNDDAINYLVKSFELNPGTENSFLDEFPSLESTQLFIKLTDSF